MNAAPKIHSIPTDAPKVRAFRLEPDFGGEDLRRVAEELDAAFDAQGRISMLLVLEDMTAADAASGFSLKSLKTQFRALSHVDRYAVVGAPQAAARMLEAFDRVSGIDARAFPREREDEAWRFVREES